MKNNLFTLILVILLLMPSTFASLDVVLQDQTTPIVDLYFSRDIANLTLDKEYFLGDQVINVSSSVAPLVDDIVELKQINRFSQYEVVSVNSLGGSNYELLLDTPLDFGYNSSANAYLKNYEMAVDGSVNPVVFSVNIGGLNNATSWDITRILLEITDSTSMDTSKFGGIPSLTNGVVLTGVDGISKNIFNVKNNGELALRMYDVTYQNKAPSGEFGLNARRSFAGQDKAGVAIRLENSEVGFGSLKVLVQDDLTGLNSFNMVAQGHVVDDSINNSVEVEELNMLAEISILALVFLIGVVLAWLGKFIRNYYFIGLSAIWFVMVAVTIFWQKASFLGIANYALTLFFIGVGALLGVHAWLEQEERKNSVRRRRYD